MGNSLFSIQGRWTKPTKTLASSNFVEFIASGISIENRLEDDVNSEAER